MSTTTSTINGVQVLTVDGELAAGNVRQFRREAEKLLNRDERDYIVDLRNTTLVDSAGLEALTWLQARSEERLGAVKVAGANPAMETVLKMTRLDERFERHASTEAAAASFG